MVFMRTEYLNRGRKTTSLRPVQCTNVVRSFEDLADGRRGG